ncbi:MAG: hypothetical protein H6Q19_1724 [Bacteroidetes bacterium]|nr:hypothetical protein [Bacteroidota bacterium]
MRKYLIFLLAMLFFLSPASGQRKKVGVVLMGGGAKGFAHVGALKVLEEAGIPIDYIAGTSMGAIVGGLYSIGYDSHTLDSLIHKQDWMHLLTDDVYRYNLTGAEREKAQTYIVSINYEKQGIKLPSGIVDGQNILNLLLDLTTGYHDELNFRKLPIPFSCVAADVKSGKEVVLNSGSLPVAMRSSMAIPGFFSPVKLDSMLLIDGGILNNYPVDVVRKMGADIVIGISFEKDEKKVEKDMGSILELTHDFENFLGKEKFDQNLKNTDLPIRVNLGKYSIASFQMDEIDSIMRIGEATARKKWDELTELKKQLDISDNNLTPYIHNPYIGLDTLSIRSVHVEGLSPEDEQLVLNRIRIQPKISRADLQNSISSLYGTNLFSKVHYRLENTRPPYDLVLEVEKKNIRNLNIGVRFDTEELASVLVNTSIRLKTTLNSTFGVTARLNRNPYLLVDYSLNRSVLHKGSVKIKTSKNDIYIYDLGKLAYNIGYYQNSLKVNLSEFYFYNVKLQLGTNFDYFYYLYELRNSGQPSLNLESKPYISYSLNGTYDNLNSSYYPTKGMYINFNYTVTTNKFFRLDDQKPMQDLSFTLIKPVKLNKQMTLTPNVSGRIIVSDTVPFIYSNLVGGQWNNHYVNQQISLEGLQGMEIFRKTVVKTQVNFKYDFNKNNSLQFVLNYTMHNDNPLEILKGRSYFGGTLGYTYSTLAGPIIFRLNYSDRTRKFYPYLSVGYYF